MNLIPTRVVTLIWSSLILLAAPVNAATVTANFTAATTIPVTATSYTAAGNTVNLTLSFAPPAGTVLTVVKNTGLAFIQGTFDNLAQGQKVNLTYGGITYPFVANYFGGTGNDLVLHWANTRLLAWGSNDYGQLGDASLTNKSVPSPVLMSGVLAGKTVLAATIGYYHSLVLCADGTLASWGENGEGQLGNNRASYKSFVPTLVDRSGVLAGKTVIAIDNGSSHCLALCSDGTLASWGSNTYGQLGNGGPTNVNKPSPVLVDISGVLAGKSVVAIAAGGGHSLALCADGVVAAWGNNSYGPLGNNSSNQSAVPVLVNTTGVLAGKTVVAIAAGLSHSMALCSDGTLAAWGTNYDGQLGNATTSAGSLLPVLVSKTGGLSGKTPVAIACGAVHSLALCSDGSIATWGSNNNGQLGNSSTTSSSVAVAVNRTGVLASKTVTAVSAGFYHSVARCADGTVASWGDNFYGELGNNSTTDSPVPVLAGTGNQGADERVMAAISSQSGYYDIAVLASPAPPIVQTLAATDISDTRATLNGSANANGTGTSVSFEYGPTLAYGNSIATTPAAVTGTTATAVRATPANLLSNTTYHYRITTSGQGGTVTGEDLTFTTTQLASLSGLTLSAGILSPGFAATTTAYSATVANSVTSVTLTPLALSPAATVTINGATLAAGAASDPIDLAVGGNVIAVLVTGTDGTTTQTYTLTVTRLPEIYAFDSATTVPVTAWDVRVADNEITLALNYAPSPGTTLTVIDNPGAAPIQGRFANLAQGQRVTLTYGGIPYSFVASYYGGTGNDLVLLWANTRALAWGYNNYGQLGNNNMTNGLVPEPVVMSEVLAGKTLTAVACGATSTYALCADGTLAAWGYNYYGQLGNNSTTNSPVPVLVNQTGVLAGKTVTAIAAGTQSCLVSCADGTLAAWGYNYYGQLGNNTTTNSQVPVLVNLTGVLSGKTVTAISAGSKHCLVLCSDGSLAAWGNNDYGQLGNGGMASSSVPVLVDRTGVLAGKTVVSISAGFEHNLVLCADGTLAGWGSNWDGEVGNGMSNSQIYAPILVSRAGALAGKTVVGISASGSDLGSHSLALCSDGTVAAWGYNSSGQLGNNSTTNSNVAVPVNMTGVLLGKPVKAIAAGVGVSLSLCADGTLAAWGGNSAGQLGNNSTTNSSVPVLVNTTSLLAGERLMAGLAGGISSHSIVVVASPTPPVATTLAASEIADAAATLNGLVNASGTSTAATFEYGLTTSYGTTVPAIPANLTGTTAVAVGATAGGLRSATTYHYRVIAGSPGGTVTGEDMTFTTTNLAVLSSLSLSTGALVPEFSGTTTSYCAIVPSATASITVTPVAQPATSTVTVNGITVPSGMASSPVNLNVGNNLIQTVVTAADGFNTKTYAVTVTRPPEVFAFNSATEVPVTLGDLLATSNTATFALNFAPTAGADLTVVNNTGRDFIHGTFDNLAQGQPVKLTYGGVTYTFVANYFGGTGNDLVLQWANTRLFGWGFNYSGELGNNSTTNASLPAPVDMSGVLAGKTVIAMAAGTDSSVSSGHSLAVCADGTLAAWGSNNLGKLGNNSTTNSAVPVLVDRSGVLAGKTVIALAAGINHSLALCTDGTLAAWGYNDSGQLGNNSNTQSTVPVLVDRTGVLAGKSVTAIAAGLNLSLALCADGTLAAWGANGYGQLGNNSTTSSSVPVLVDRSGVLANKMIVAVATGKYHVLALCSDGSLAAWGYNNAGQLGNGGTVNSTVPVWVNRSGVLAGKAVAAIAAGTSFSLARCADGTLAAWGDNNYGQLGNTSSSSSTVPALVTMTGVLSGKVVNTISAGESHSLVLCADGAFAAWGNNNPCRLGNGVFYGEYPSPILVNTTTLRPGERFVAGVAGPTAQHNLALAASPPRAEAATLAATGIMDTSATLHGSISANGTSTTVAFEYGLTSSYGATLAAVPATVTGTAATATSANLSGLSPGTLYHYRIVASSVYGTSTGEDMTFTTSNFGALAGLALGTGELAPAFFSILFNYSAMVPHAVDSLTLTPLAANASSTVTVNGSPVASGTASGALALADGTNVIRVVVTGADGVNSLTYTLTVIRLADAYAFNTAADVPVTSDYVALTGGTAGFTLNFAPPAGTRLTVVNNTGREFIHGTFDNLAQGQLVPLTYGGITYPFVANYFGGTGNDLVLQWANNRLHAWGDNTSGQLGNDSTVAATLPVLVDPGGVLAGRTILTAIAGGTRNLLLCADGSLFQWGMDTAGNLGTNNGAASKVPVPVDLSGVLAGKRVTRIAVGDDHCLALCSDGTLAAWGNNNSGQLGNASAAYPGETNPVLVNQTGVLAGKTVIAIAAGAFHNLVLCADGSLAVWGNNYRGQLGDGTTTNRSQPLLVNRSGVLAGKSITAIAAGAYHSLVLCADGTLAGWGYNSNGQLGNNSTASTSAPVLVNRTGVLAGKTVTALTAGSSHSAALCADGTLAAWGSNSYGQLGNGSSTNASVPVLVTRTGVLASKTITAIAGGQSHSTALCADGTTASWGYNASGQLGNGSTTNSNVPVLVNTSMLPNSGRYATLSCGSNHILAIAALPPAPVATTLAATAITDTTATLNGRVNAQGSTTGVTFQYGLTDSYGLSAAATPALLGGTTTTAVALNLTGLTSGATWHFRVVTNGAGGITRGADATFTTTNLSQLADLALGAGTLTPAFAPATVSYITTVPYATTSLTLTPQTEIASTTITVNGATVASGAASNPLPLAVGNNPLTVVTTAANGLTTMTYTVTVTRLPQSFTFNSATTVPVTAADLLADGLPVNFALAFAPATGTDLTVVNNTGTTPIRGQFSNLVNGQAVALDFGGATYLFVADYFGGTGNDLVLRWANTRPFAWGANASGQVGNNSTTDALVPVAVDRTGVLANKVVTALTAGVLHKVALCHDGTLAAWGSNSYQQAGFTQSQSSVPLAVPQQGALSNKTVSAITTGSNYSLALDTDGFLLAWGHNDSSGQLGNNSDYDPGVPVEVDRSGVLKDRRVVAMSAGGSHSLALCADGTLVAWGGANSGQLGNGNNTGSPVPVTVIANGALAGKRVVAIAAGRAGFLSGSHSLALCSDGTLATWGYNSDGQLGNNTTTASPTPVAVFATGVLAGKSVAAIAVGYSHNLALCTDGTLISWGNNRYGQLGNNSTTNSNVPVAVVRNGVLSGKTVTGIAADTYNSYALCSDGTLAAWGINSSGELGNNTTSNSSVPVVVSTANLTSGERFVKLAGAALALAASPPQYLTPSIADGSSVVGTSQQLAWNREPLAASYQVFFGTTRDAVANATATSPEYLGDCQAPVWSGSQPALASNTQYFWRVDTLYATGRRPGKVWSFRIAPIEMATSVNHVIIKGMAAATVDIPITTPLTNPQPWSVSATSLPAWLTLVAATGTTPQPLRLRFDPGSLATGPYQTVLRVVAGAAAFDLPVSFRIVDINLTKLLAHPTRPVVYGINPAASGEAFARVVEIDAATGTMLRTLPIGPGPTDADIDPAGGRLYVPNMVNWKHVGTRVIDLANWTELPTLALGTTDYKLEATATGRILTEGADQWVTANLYDAATGTKLKTLGSVRAGDCEVDPTGRFYYHCDSNSSGACIRKYDISSDTFVSVANGPVLAYGSLSLLLSPDGTRLFWQGFSFAADDLHALARLPGEVYATTRSGDLAVGAAAVWWADSGTQAATLPFSSTVATVSANDSHLVRYNSSTKTIVSTPARRSSRPARAMAATGTGTHGKPAAVVMVGGARSHRLPLVHRRGCRRAASHGVTHRHSDHQLL